MSVEHDSFTLDRRLDATPARAFAALGDPDIKRRWFLDQDGADWTVLHWEMDFRVGGVESGAWRRETADGTSEIANRTVYLEIMPDARIVSAYTMAVDGRIISASLGTFTLAADGAGTRLTYTEQMTILDGGDTIDGRRSGMEWLLKNLAAEFEREAA